MLGRPARRGARSPLTAPWFRLLVPPAHRPDRAGLDNFDVTAKWRLRENGVPVDTRRPLRRHGGDVAERTRRRPACAADSLVCTFTENLLAFVTGRRVEHVDQPTVRAIPRVAESGRLPDGVVHHGHGQKRPVPAQAERLNARSGKGETMSFVHHRKTPASPDVPARNGGHSGAAVRQRDGPGGPPRSQPRGGHGGHDAAGLY